MKLIKRTYLLTLFWLTPVLIIGGLFCFFMIVYISYEETDEYLRYEMERLVSYYNENYDLPEYHKVADILPGIKYNEPVFKDTLLLESGDNEMVPYRELYFSINHKGQDFTIVLRHLLLGRDDVFEGTLLIIGGLMFLIAFSIILIINVIAGRIWKPFYNTLDRAVNFKIGRELPVFGTSNIDEFNSLNHTLYSLLRKIDTDFRRNKEFNENLSHELQTQLAIIRSNIENLINEVPESTVNPDKLKSVYTAVTKLSQFQKSLLQLSKISNMEYANNTNTDISEILQQTVNNYREAIEMRDIILRTTVSSCISFMDAGLAEVLVNNLVKNAVKHNINGGNISITLNTSFLNIENTGRPYNGIPEKLMERFTTGENGNYGIGLSIVKQICDLYNFTISYEIDPEAVHKITVRFAGN